jgi:hypothetical protein
MSSEGAEANSWAESRQRLAWCNKPAAHTRTLTSPRSNTRSRIRPKALPKRVRCEWSFPYREQSGLVAGRSQLLGAHLELLEPHPPGVDKLRHSAPHHPLGEYFIEVS